MVHLMEMLPIRKVSPDRVVLTSYYGKTWVSRSPKSVNNYPAWLCNRIMVKGLDSSDTDITDISAVNVFDNEFVCPRIYSIIAMQFQGFVADSYKFNFDHKAREKLYGKEALAKYEKDSMLLIAKSEHETYLAIDNSNNVYELSNSNTELKGTLENFLHIDAGDAPVEYAELKLFGKPIPIAFILCYQMGLSKLLEKLNVEPRRVLAGQRLNLEAHEYTIAFSDMTLVFSRDDKLATMILAGLNSYSKPLKKYVVSTLDSSDVYYNILDAMGLTARFLREIDLFSNLFIDPITKELLIEMKEPTTVQGLLIRSSEMLLLDQHPHELDMGCMRIKGYERFAGAVYSELVHSIRAHGSKPGKSSKPIDLHPYAVWKTIVQDPAVGMVSDLNPIENLKQLEAITYSGIGGRGSRSMTKSTREYHESDIGVISESTVDSSNVAVNTYTSADPQFKSVRGTTKPYIHGKTGATALLSTSALLSAGSDHDDPKRVN
jgi:hypothetical protein